MEQSTMKRPVSVILIRGIGLAMLAFLIGGRLADYRSGLNLDFNASWAVTLVATLFAMVALPAYLIAGICLPFRRKLSWKIRGRGLAFFCLYPMLFVGIAYLGSAFNWPGFFEGVDKTISQQIKPEELRQFAHDAQAYHAANQEKGDWLPETFAKDYPAITDIDQRPTIHVTPDYVDIMWFRAFTSICYLRIGISTELPTPSNVAIAKCSELAPGIYLFEELN